MQLVIVDTVQIQPYIFGSNRLRENVGASHLVAQATSGWAMHAVRAAAAQHNIAADGKLDPARRIESDDLDAEVIHTGGGNFVALFADEDGAGAFTRALSRRVLTDAPNLQLVITPFPFHWGESLARAMAAAFRELARDKRGRSLSTPLLGLGVTVMCRSTGLPSVGLAPGIGGDPNYPASAEILAKVEAATRQGVAPSEADARLQDAMPAPKGYVYPRDLDHLGRTAGEHSYIAVVHADGNGIGKRVQEIGQAHIGDNRGFIAALRQFSAALEAAATEALCVTLGKLEARLGGTDQIVHKNGQGQELARIGLRRADGGWFLPFRPIVFGGDDVTFVCDGRLGLSLAIEYLGRFEQRTADLPDGKGKATACAGVAIVKSHYPFARAYAMADELCRSAKRYRREQDLQGSCFDWHFAPSGLAGDIDGIRRREYTVREGSLTLRPLALSENPIQVHRRWEVVRKGVEAFQDTEWAGRRNKVKALRDALRAGRGSVEWFLARFNQGRPLPDVEPSMTNWPTSGWQSDYCGYFDAVELADWFIPLTDGGA